MPTRRRFMSAFAAVAAANTAAFRVAHAQRRPTIDVKKIGAFGNGKLPDLRQLRQAVEMASEHSGGATIYFPPGEYYLGAVDGSALLATRNLRNVRFIGERATLSCRSVNGMSDMLTLAGSRNVSIEGLSFIDHGLDRANRMGAHAISFVYDDGMMGCEDTKIMDCKFDSVLGAVTCHGDAGRAKARGITLTNLSVSRSYYGFNFADSGDDVVGRGLRCTDVKRSYFPYGVSNHDIELDTSNNATGYTDVLIKCYNKDTSGLRVKVKCRGKRSGDAIVALDQQHVKGRGLIRKVVLDLDIDDADCQLQRAILIRALDPHSRHEPKTDNRWDEIFIDGDIRICEKTRLIDIASVGNTTGRLYIGSRLAKHPGLPRTYPGFIVSRAT